MSRPLYDVVSEAVNVLREHPALPPPINFAVNQEGIWIIPWRAGAPLTALLDWVSEMSEVEITGSQMDQNTYAVTAQGILDKLPFTITSTTYRPLTIRADGHVSVEELRRVASQEEPYDRA